MVAQSVGSGKQRDEEESNKEAPVEGGGGPPNSPEIVESARLPTSARPGSEEKIRMLTLRAEWRIPLFDDNDGIIYEGRYFAPNGDQEGHDDEGDWDYENQPFLKKAAKVRKKLKAKRANSKAIEESPSASSDGVTPDATDVPKKVPQRKRSSSQRPKTNERVSSLLPVGTVAEQVEPERSLADLQGLASVYRSLVAGVRSGSIMFSDQESFERGNPEVVAYVNRIDQAQTSPAQPSVAESESN